MSITWCSEMRGKLGTMKVITEFIITAKIHMYINLLRDWLEFACVDKSMEKVFFYRKLKRLHFCAIMINLFRLFKTSNDWTRSNGNR